MTPAAAAAATIGTGAPAPVPPGGWPWVLAVLLTLGGGAGFKASMNSEEAASAVKLLTEETKATRAQLDELARALGQQRVDAATVAARAAALEARVDQLEREVYSRGTNRRPR
jgi:hypothetical protein